MIGSTISRYQILERLGGGGMGVVYKAKDLLLDRWVALKFLSTDRGGGTGEENRRRFLREAKAASALDHANICAVFDIGEGEEGRLYIAMAYCAGETLKSRIARGPLSPTEAADIAAQIADGLAEAHNKGITHRDIKPANVIVGEGGRIKIVDFGLAGFADQTRLTRPGIAIGTASYMSPEQCRGEAADPATDIWALGVVLYEMLAGQQPFRGDRPEQVIKTILRRRPDPIPGVPPELARIVNRALEKDPLDRYPNAEAFGADLQSFRQGHDPRWEQTLSDVSMSPLWNPRGAVGEAETGSGGMGLGLVGKTISHYRIGQPLGGGGMGIVYRAEDLRLERTVALKFLPPELSYDPEAKERFLKEARAASSLDHPNVCTIHEVGETEDGRLFLSMPCYLGETLRERIARGPLPLEEALDYARQIARGLVKAHRSGIVHRDIKPANLLITEDGVVKILDFGLAKLAGAVALTRVGSSIGTPSYMSPEQARGGEVDPRTDLWSLGVILYEMVTGRRPFRGEHEQAIVYALLNETPEPVAKNFAEAPEGLTRLIGRLLAKDRDARPGSADEVLTELKVLSGITLAATGMQTAASSTGPSGAGIPATSAVPGLRLPQPWRRSLRPWLAGLAAVAAAVWLVLLVRGPRLPQVNFKWLTDQGGRALFPSVSPDGNVFVYTREDGGDLDIFLQSTSGGGINLTAESSADDSQPAYSPDGTQIAFRSERGGGGIFLMGATGGEPRRLTDFGFNPAWSPDGTALVVATQPVTNPTARYSKSELHRVSVGSGEKTLLARGDAVQPSWSPNGRRIAYWGISQDTARRALWTLPSAGGEPRLAYEDEHLSWNPVWSPDGRHLYFVSNRGGSMNLWRLRIDESSGEARGEPEALTTPAPSIGFLSLAKDGRRIIFAIDDSRNSLRGTAFDPATLAASTDLAMVLRSTRGVRSAEVSPDGRYIAFHTAGPREDLGLLDLKDSAQREVTSDDHRDRHPHWSPDGKLLVFYSDRKGDVGIWTIRPDGSDLKRLVPARSGERDTFPIWSPDGRRLLWTQGEGNPMLLDLSLPAAARKPQPLPRVAEGTGRFAPYSWSSDGEWLAGDLYLEGRTTPRLGVYSFRTRSVTALTERGSAPVFLRDGRHILYIDEGRVFAVDRLTGQVRLVLAPPPSSSFASVSLDPQNRKLYLVSRDDQGEIGMATLD